MSQPPSLIPPRPPNWLARNWQWLVPVLVLANAALIYGIFAAILGVMKSSDAYQLAVARTRAAPAVVAALGTPITEGYFVSGNVHVTNSAGQAQLEIPVKGPKAAATIYVVAEKSAGQWRFETLIVQVDRGGGRLDLSDPAPSGNIRR